MFKFHPTNKYTMPAHFGGEGRDPNAPRPMLEYGDCTGVSVTYETDREALSRYVPEGFEITVPYLIISFVGSRQINWMGGGYYNLVDVSVPVKYIGNNEGLVGAYSLVIWEDKTEPILGGREGNGMPKVFGNIEELRMLNGVYSTNVSYYGRTFLDMEIRGVREATAAETDARNAYKDFYAFGWRYIPNCAGKDGAAVSHATCYPQRSTVSKLWFGEGKIQWTKLAFEQHPTQAHIISALADLPIVRYIGASMNKSVLNLMPMDTRELP